MVNDQSIQARNLEERGFSSVLRPVCHGKQEPNDTESR